MVSGQISEEFIGSYSLLFGGYDHHWGDKWGAWMSLRTAASASRPSTSPRIFSSESLCLLFLATVSHYTFFPYIKRLLFCTRHLVPIGDNQITLSLVLERQHRLSSSSLSRRYLSPYFVLALLGCFLLMFQSCNIFSLIPAISTSYLA